MSTRPPTAEERRRAQRVLVRIRVNVQVAGKDSIAEGFTHTVSASGAMLLLQEGLAEGTKITIENPKAQSKVEARVVRPPQMTHEGSLVPVEFTSPSPNFWGIFFPPTIN
ncbi:MAG TPA: PilZ domain-containing protein [Candidatus Acidoferrum sp.]|nr:PilZ domain-containing protein [Candidatus Acidoferrum sp.]